ncbi:MAG: glycosyltransferase family 4 protein [Symploca sp. SIO3C6]|uniref:Glycosyltransferase family 4 protein n=1 Tax=Symploca sp. SIO1C4 TaxID=2607765 RepID=A0A6B3MYJ4_9CYAN|nr:glycosyltransferase family 4 protein [Symploca sp. SIO3C6]NER26486.1 glycosyltransferase family 4 protein [Symploca sp. SIO1C4]
MYFILAIASAVLSLLGVALIKQRWGKQLLDIPNQRSSHSQPTPRGGGIGFIIAFAITGTIASTLTSNLPQILLTTPNPSYIWLILTPLALIGIIDDKRGVPAVPRYLVQLLAASIMIAHFGLFPLPWLSNLGIIGQIIAISLTLIGITALINFYNFMDGLDGLVASVSALQLGFLALYLNQPLFLLLAAALLGFLWWNWSPAKIFMGDAGSTVLGATVAIALLNNNNQPSLTWSALAVTFPLIGDAIYTLSRRLIRRENIFKAHRSHLYQRLQQSGWSHRQVAIAYLTATATIILAITTFGTIGSWLSLIAVIIAIATVELYLQSRSTFATSAPKVHQQKPDVSVGSTKIPAQTLP